MESRHKQVAATLGVLLFHVFYGVLKERLFAFRDSAGQQQQITLALTFMQCSFASATFQVLGYAPPHCPRLANLYPRTRSVHHLANFDQRADNGMKRETIDGKLAATFPQYAGIALVYLLSTVAVNEALKFVTYPFQVLCKSSKILPVMMGEVFLNGKKYGLFVWIRKLIMVMGIILFFLFDAIEENEDNNGDTNYGRLYGVCLLTASLICDGILSPWQKRIKTQYKVSSLDMGAHLNTWAAIYLMGLMGMASHTALAPQLSLSMSNPRVLSDMVLVCILGTLGQLCILYLVLDVGPLYCALITTSRKFISIVLATCLNNNSFTDVQWIGLTFVFAILAWECMRKVE